MLIRQLKLITQTIWRARNFAAYGALPKPVATYSCLDAVKTTDLRVFCKTHYLRRLHVSGFLGLQAR